MNVIPIVFAFNYKVTMPAGVCFTSLLKSAKPETFYDIHIMHGEGELNKEYQSELLRLKDHFKNFDIKFINIGNVFSDVYVARGIPRLTYYKIIISEVITNYNKVIFSDVDIIFSGDLWELFSTVDLTTNYIAGVKSAFGGKYMEKIGCDNDTYINCGFLVYNLKGIRNNRKLIDSQKALCGKKWIFLDQDIVNIVFKGKISFIPPKYNATFSFFISTGSQIDKLKQKYSPAEISEALNPVVLHYTGNNPWVDFCPRHDVWWQHYRESIYYDYKFYFNHYEKLTYPTIRKGISNFMLVIKKPIGKVYRKFFPF